MTLLWGVYAEKFYEDKPMSSVTYVPKYMYKKVRGFNKKNKFSLVLP